MSKSLIPCRLPRTEPRGFSPIFITAGISIFALLAVAGWQINAALHERTASNSYVAQGGVQGQAEEDSPSSALSSLEPETMSIGTAILNGVVGEYISLQERGLYTPEVGEKTAEKMAETLHVPISSRTYSPTDITTDADVSYARMLAYRNDLQVSLAPLLRNTQPEYEIFAYYISTKDKTNLQKLQRAAQNYREAARASAKVTVPKDALDEHLAMLNSMEGFAAILDALTENADDPLASAVLLRSYNQGETDVLASFSGLAKYYREKQS